MSRRKQSPKASARRPDWEDGGGIDDDGTPNPVPDPSLPTPPRTLFRPGPDKVAVMAARHAAGYSLWCPADLTQPIDYVSALCEVGAMMREEVLAERGLRWLANGISTVPGPTPADPPQFRAQVWDVNLNDHIEVGRAPTRGAAVNLIIDWARVHLGLDVNVQPPDWLKHILGDAIRLQAERNEDD